MREGLELGVDMSIRHCPTTSCFSYVSFISSAKFNQEMIQESDGDLPGLVDIFRRLDERWKLRDEAVEY